MQGGVRHRLDLRHQGITQSGHINARIIRQHNRIGHIVANVKRPRFAVHIEIIIEAV